MDIDRVNDYLLTFWGRADPAWFAKLLHAADQKFDSFIEIARNGKLEQWGRAELGKEAREMLECFCKRLDL